MRLQQDGLDSLVKQLGATSEDQQCNFLENHSSELVKDESIYKFVRDIFEEAQEGRADDTLVLQCLAERLEKNLNIRHNRNKETLLHEAVHKKRVKSVKYLLGCKVPMDVRNKYGHSAVESAVLLNCASCLTLFLERGADPDERFATRCDDRQRKQDKCQDEWSLAHFAVQKGRVECLRILNQHKANLSATDDMGLSLAHTAISNKKLDMLLELGKLNASPAPSYRQRVSQKAKQSLRKELT